MAKWPNHFISCKQFQKRPNLAYLAFKKAKWQPRARVSHSFPLQNKRENVLSKPSLRCAIFFAFHTLELFQISLKLGKQCLKKKITFQYLELYNKEHCRSEAGVGPCVPS
jgi:hypothetical protein